jgi:radical SAM superfamily enzyme YgiQ (UPF0313 family)
MSAAVLIFPPMAKACEPPAGLPALGQAVLAAGHRVTLIDANIQGIHALLQQPVTGATGWTRHARQALPDHLHRLRQLETYRNVDNYKRMVRDVNRVLGAAGSDSTDAWVTLSDYQQDSLSPVSSRDLLQASREPQRNAFYPYFRDTLLPEIECLQPDLIGLSLCFLNQALCAFSLMGMIRDRMPHCPLVVGGGLVTSWMCQPGFATPFDGLIDHLIAGPGEQPLVALMNQLDRVQEGSHGVEGDPTDRETTPAGKRQPVLPRFESFSGHPYIAPGFILPYSTTRGCYWNRCRFCPERSEGSRYQATPVARVRTELYHLVKRHRPVLIHFLDNAIPLPMLRSLADDPLPVPWYGYVRFSRHLTDPEFCRCLKRSGCVMLKLGLESGDADVLEAMEKGIDLRQASLALHQLKRAGIATYVYLLFGTPTETREHAGRTREFIIRHAGEIDFLNLAIFNLPRFSEDSVTLRTRPFYRGDLSLYEEFQHPLGWNRGEVRRFLQNEVRKHPAIAPILRQTPPYFAANHAPFLVRDAS